MKTRSINTVFLGLCCALLLFASASYSQSLTAEDYARAEKMLSYNTAPLVDRNGVRPTFLPDGRFWYMVLTPTGREYVMVNPADGSKQIGDSLTKIGVTAPAAGGGQGRFGGIAV